MIQTCTRRKLYLFVCFLLLGITLYGCVKMKPTVMGLDDEYISKGNSRVYYTDNIPQKDIDALINFFDTDDYFRSHKYLKFDKSDSDEYFIYIYVHEYVFSSETQLKFYQNTADVIAINLFYPNQVTFFLCNNEWEPIKTIVSDLAKIPNAD